MSSSNNTTQPSMSLRQVRVYKPVDGQEPDVVMPDGGKYYGQVLSQSTHTVDGDWGGSGSGSSNPPASAGTGANEALSKPQFISGSLKIPHGQGILISPDGSRYGGSWHQGKMHGAGSIIADTFDYEGQWDGDKIHGFGTIHYKDAIGGVGGAIVRGLTTLSPFDHKVKPLEYRGEFHKTYHRHGKGTMTYRNGDSYEGEWHNNRRAGQGTFKSHAGEKYVGEWVEDEKCGEGTVSFPNGSIYHGTLHEDKRSGHGTMIFPNGDEYTGNFADDVMEGSGSCTYKNGDRYEGQWKDGMRYGEGTFFLEKRGAIVRGNFVKGLLHGRGSVEFPGKSYFVGDFSKGERLHGVVWTTATHCKEDAQMKGSRSTSPLPSGAATTAGGASGTATPTSSSPALEDCYSGEWRSDSMHGKGIMWYGSGDFYYGQWVNSMRHGHGCQNYADGSEFAGDFVMGERTGVGLLKKADGTVASGLWKDGELLHGYNGEWDGHHFNGIGHLVFPNGDQYQGLFHNGLRHGAGSFSSQGKMTYRGDWFNDAPHGRGTAEYPNGEVYEGDWAGGLRCGTGTMVDPQSSSVFQGRFRDDLADGAGTLWCHDAMKPLYKLVPIEVDPSIKEREEAELQKQLELKEAFLEAHHDPVARMEQLTMDAKAAGTSPTLDLPPPSLVEDDEEWLPSDLSTTTKKSESPENNKRHKTQKKQLQTASKPEASTTAGASTMGSVVSTMTAPALFAGRWVASIPGRLTSAGDIGSDKKKKKKKKVKSPNTQGTPHDDESGGSEEDDEDHPGMRKEVVGYEPMLTFRGGFSHGKQKGSGHLFLPDTRVFAASWIEGFPKLEMPHRVNIISPTSSDAPGKLPDSSSSGQEVVESCSFCHSAFGFFRKQLRCALCRRSSCSTCLKEISPVPPSVSIELSEKESVTSSAVVAPTSSNPVMAFAGGFFGSSSTTAATTTTAITSSSSTAAGNASTNGETGRRDSVVPSAPGAFPRGGSGSKPAPNPTADGNASAQVLHPGSPVAGALAESVKACSDCFICVKQKLVRVTFWDPRPEPWNALEDADNMSPFRNDDSQWGQAATAGGGASAEEEGATSALSPHSSSSPSMPAGANQLLPMGATARVLCYKGYCTEDAPHLNGTMWFGDRSRYHGDFQYGLKSGFGTLSHKNGEEYVGSWGQGGPSALGKYRYSDGTVFEGSWLPNDPKAAQKTTLLAEGIDSGSSATTGEAKKDKSPATPTRGVPVVDGAAMPKLEGGAGVMEKLLYRGEMDDDLRRHGSGMAFYENGDRYNGEWVNGKRQGTGMMQFCDGSIYTGEFFADRMEGHGRLLKHDADGGGAAATAGGGGAAAAGGSLCHVGAFVHGLKHGPGVERTGDRIVEATWDKGVLCGRVVVRDLVEETVYEGVWGDDGQERTDIIVRQDPVSDASVTTCGACNSAFGLFLRRHHCRCCGGVFCDYCSKRRIDLPSHFLLHPQPGPYRVCMGCYVKVSEGCSLGIHQTNQGAVYAGKWSRGRRVGKGLVRQPDGQVFVTREDETPDEASTKPPATEQQIANFADWWKEVSGRTGLGAVLKFRLQPLPQLTDEQERQRTADNSMHIKLFDPDRTDRPFIPSIVSPPPSLPKPIGPKPRAPMIVDADTFDAKVNIRRQTDAATYGPIKCPAHRDNGPKRAPALRKNPSESDAGAQGEEQQENNEGDNDADDNETGAILPINYGTPPKPLDREYRQQDWAHWDLPKLPVYNPAIAVEDSRASALGIEEGNKKKSKASSVSAAKAQASGVGAAAANESNKGSDASSASSGNPLAALTKAGTSLKRTLRSEVRIVIGSGTSAPAEFVQAAAPIGLPGAPVFPSIEIPTFCSMDLQPLPGPYRLETVINTKGVQVNVHKRAPSENVAQNSGTNSRSNSGNDISHHQDQDQEQSLVVGDEEGTDLEEEDHEEKGGGKGGGGKREVGKEESKTVISHVDPNQETVDPSPAGADAEPREDEAQ